MDLFINYSKEHPQKKLYKIPYMNQKSHINDILALKVFLPLRYALNK